MKKQKPTVVLVHGAFAESASWNGVLARLQEQNIPAVAVANPLRSVHGDAAYVRDVTASIEGPVVLVGHSYGGFVITEAAAANPEVAALVYVCAFAPDHRENAFELSGRFPGSTLGDAVALYPLSVGGNDLVIRQDVFAEQFAADVPREQAALMAATQRPVAQAALLEGLPTDKPGWMTQPSWFVFSDQDRNIPVALHRYMARRADARGIREVAGASHALGVSNPAAVASSIVEAVEGWDQ